MRPEDKSRNILVGIVLVIIVALIALFLIRRRPAINAPTFSPLPTSTSSFQQNLENNFGITIPSSALKADLRDVTGGSQMGLLTLDKEGTQNSYTLLANLDDPQPGSFYQAWLVRGRLGDSNFSTVSLGKLSLAKGGWLITLTTPTDFSDHKTIWLTQEKVFDTTPETHILEGSF